MENGGNQRPDVGDNIRSLQLLRGALGGLAAVTMLFMMLLTLIDVTGRAIFSRPIPGSYEIMEFGLAIVIFSALPLVTWDRQHINVSILDSFFRHHAYRMQQILIQTVTSIGFVIICYCMWRQWRKLTETQALTGYLEWPIAPIALFMFILAGLGLVCALWLLWCALIGRSYPSYQDQLNEPVD